ncbi:MAG: bacillithiol biosynthesis cysteine-adding enzyme BshC, partial [Acidobacteria bacterium]|nr:bacillithiol biosynthesis cysteine-adding enzyme BshC [Acidobacteriota bacterium]
ASRIQYPVERRALVAAILERQNLGWGAGPKVIENIARFRAGAAAVVTGQQVGLFGGPAFSIYKALSAVKLAGEARRLGIDCVPVFWLATEDHDLAEVDQAHVPSADGKLESLAGEVESGPDAPVGTVSLGPEISREVSRLRELVGESEWADAIAECYRPDENFGSAFAKLYSRWFADHGVILLDGSDPELDQIARPLYLAALDESEEITRSLVRRNQELETLGYHQQVRVTESSTLFFLIRDRARVPVQARNPGEFLIAEEKLSRRELRERADRSPESLSPNVLLRPVAQDYLLPTLAYVGGAAEIAYFAQAGALQRQLLGRATPVVPRLSATIVEPKTRALLEKNRLAASDVFQPVEAVRELIGARRLPPNLEASFDQAAAAIERSMKAVGECLAELDKTLVESAENAKSKMLYQVTNLRARASRSELRQSEVIGRHADSLSQSLYPEKVLQERRFAGIYFLAKYGQEWMNGLVDTIHPDCLNHQIIEL